MNTYIYKCVATLTNEWSVIYSVVLLYSMSSPIASSSPPPGCL